MTYIDDFKAVFSKPGVLEPELQKYMEENTEVIPIPGLLTHGLFWGAVFPQFEVGRKKVDFMFITKNSFELKIVLIEIERPNKILFLSSGHIDFHSQTRRAIAQIMEWKSYIYDNGDSFKNSLGILIPQTMDFDKYPIQIEYLLIIGRNEGDYTKAQRGLLIGLKHDNDILLLSYDSIIRGDGQNMIGEKKDILGYSNDVIRLKHSNCDSTNIFGAFNKDELILNTTHIDRYKNLGYDMDSWQKGDLLTVNNKYTSLQSAGLIAKGDVTNSTKQDAQDNK